MDSKTCKDCGSVKPLGEFYSYIRWGRSKPSYSSYCKPCHAERCRATRGDTRAIATVQDRFWAKVRKGGPDECWIWTGAKNPGTGIFWTGERYQAPHRWLWEQDREPLTQFETLRDVCASPYCVNPAHRYVAPVAGGTAAPIGTKWCSRCKRFLPVNRFSRQGRAMLALCAECNHSKRLAMYGLTRRDYLLLLEEQDYRCAICGAEETDTTGRGLDVDHDHTSGRVRGLLCTRCNGGLGLLGDSPERLQAAIAYLERSTVATASA